MARLLLLVLALAAPARAQEGYGASDADSPMFSALDHSSAPATTVTPLALALSLAFDATTWLQVGVSTASPAGDMAELLAKGYYKLELLEMTLLAQTSGKRLLDLRTRRTKDGLTLRALAEEAKAPFDDIADRAAVLEEGVEARMKDLENVRALGARKAVK